MLLAQVMEALGSPLHQAQDAIVVKSIRRLSKTMNKEQKTSKTMKTRFQLTQEYQDRTMMWMPINWTNKLRRLMEDLGRVPVTPARPTLMTRMHQTQWLYLRNTTAQTALASTNSMNSLKITKCLQAITNQVTRSSRALNKTMAICWDRTLFRTSSKAR